LRRARPLRDGCSSVKRDGVSRGLSESDAIRIFVTELFPYLKEMPYMAHHNGFIQETLSQALASIN